MRNLRNLIFGILITTASSLQADEEEKRVTVIRAGTTVSQIDAASETVIRSAAELEKTPIDALLAKSLNLAGVDFEKEMVVLIRSGMINAFGVNLSILSTEVEDGELTVNWQFKPYFGGAAPPDQPGNPSLVIVLDRFDGDVKFERTNWKYPEGLPLPPSAAPPGGGVGLPKLDPQ